MNIPRNLFNVTFRNVANHNYSVIKRYYNSIPTNHNENKYYLIEYNYPKVSYFYSNGTPVSNPFESEMLREYFNIVVNYMKEPIRSLLADKKFFIKVMLRHLKLTNSKHGQTLHRNMSVFHGYKSFIQTLFFPVTGKTNGNRVIHNNSLPRTFYIPKYTLGAKRFLKTAFRTVNGVPYVHSRLNNHTYINRLANSVRGKAGKVMQFLSPIGYHAAEKVNIPHTRSIVLSHLFVEPSLYNNFFSTLGIKISKKGNTVRNDPTYYVRRNKSTLANLFRGAKFTGSLIKQSNINKLPNYGITNIKPTNGTFKNNGVTKKIPIHSFNSLREIYRTLGR